MNVNDFDESAPGDMRWGGSSAVHGAAVRGVNSVVQFLVDNGGDLNAKNRLGWTPLMLAEGMYIGQTEKEQPATAAFIRELLGSGRVGWRRPAVDGHDTGRRLAPRLAGDCRDAPVTRVRLRRSATRRMNRWRPRTGPCSTATASPATISDRRFRLPIRCCSTRSISPTWAPVPRFGRRSSESCEPAPCRRPVRRVPNRRCRTASRRGSRAALDRAAAASPNPGRAPAVRRLTRTEYRNAVRDLLALEDLPKELDVDLLLPADNTVGFDTVAELLFVTPTLMEGYVTAARKISRVAVGDPTLPLIVDTYRLPLELPQDDHFAELPLGTRGGALIRRHFPVDGEYLIKVELAGAAREPHDLEVSVDGERVGLFPIGPEQRRQTRIRG